MWFVYLLRCRDGTFYTGVTTDIDRRIAEHNGLAAGEKGAKYTKSRRPVVVVYQESVENRSAAQQRESVLRRMPRIKKLQLAKPL
jgi:putative endonuclease